jgi:PAP2 superfamily
MLTILSRAREWPETLHYWASCILLLALVPLFRRLNLPTTFDWVGLGFTYWGLLAVRSVFVASVLYLVGRSVAGSMVPGLEQIRRESIRILLILAYFAVLAWAVGWRTALMLTVDTVAVFEVRERLRPNGLWRSAKAILPPAIYLFVGLLLVSAYNDIILSTRFFAADDLAFNAIDKWMLRGASVPLLCHWALQMFPISFFRFLEFIYYGMFAQIGAALILISLQRGRHRALQFVGAVLAAYYFALLLFYLWPSQGPYYLCPVHFSQFPSTLETYAFQKGSLDGARALWNHVRLDRISFDYYIAFPCMHIVQPLIVMWFLRFSKRIVIILAAYDVLLIVAIVLLEWHYVVDVLAGVAVAVVAIALIDGQELWRRRNSILAGIPEARGRVVSQ